LWSPSRTSSRTRTGRSLASFHGRCV
jgi:hypothetical protein